MLDRTLPGTDSDISPQAVTADERGNLYVSDSKNSCIQVFRARDGTYLGDLLNDRWAPHCSVARNVCWMNLSLTNCEACLSDQCSSMRTCLHTAGRLLVSR